MIGVENRRRATAEVDGIHCAFEASAHFARQGFGSADLAFHVHDITLVQFARENSRRKIAERTLRPAKRHR
jgi:hypothetical protein